MPLLDVSEAFDPSFLDSIDVDRILQTIDQHGRTVRYKRRFSNIAAVVAATSPDDLQRIPEYSMMNRSISVYTPQFRLQGPVRADMPTTGLLDQTQPDEVLWHGSRFVVHSAQDFSGYGLGFTSAICISIDSVDAPPIGGSLGGASMMGNAD